MKNFKFNYANFNAGYYSPVILEIIKEVHKTKYKREIHFTAIKEKDSHDIWIKLNNDYI